MFKDILTFINLLPESDVYLISIASHNVLLFIHISFLFFDFFPGCLY